MVLVFPVLQTRHTYKERIHLAESIRGLVLYDQVQTRSKAGEGCLSVLDGLGVEIKVALVVIVEFPLDPRGVGRRDIFQQSVGLFLAEEIVSVILCHIAEGELNMKRILTFLIALSVLFAIPLTASAHDVPLERSDCSIQVVVRYDGENVNGGPVIVPGGGPDLVVFFVVHGGDHFRVGSNGPGLMEGISPIGEGGIQQQGQA